MIKIRRSHDRLIFMMGIPMPGKIVLILKRVPDYCQCFDTLVCCAVAWSQSAVHKFLISGFSVETNRSLFLVLAQEGSNISDHNKNDPCLLST